PGPARRGTTRPTWGGTSRTAVGKRGGTHFSMVRARTTAHARMGGPVRTQVIANLRLMVSSAPGSGDGGAGQVGVPGMSAPQPPIGPRRGYPPPADPPPGALVPGYPSQYPPPPPYPPGY